ncbi:MAG TPA: CoA protein activase [Dehalococcoidia bacterium]|nr:CoA protein activase [Dehalococcoidia bacterium]
MRVTAPHLAHLWVGLKGTLEELGVESVPPPPTSRRTLSLGVKYSPEGLCLPFKLTLGNFIEALEAGADTLLMAAGTGTCRLGRYHLLQKQILQDLGYKFKMIPLGVSEKKFLGLLHIFKFITGGASWAKIIPAVLLGLKKYSVIDDIEREVNRVRAVEREKGAASRILRQAITAIAEAKRPHSLREIRKYYLEKLAQVPRNPNIQPLKVMVMGEFYVVLEPFSNLDVEIELGKLGCEVHRNLYLSDWTKFSFFLNPLGMNEKQRVHRAALPYLKRDVGGDGWESVGEKVLHAQDYDGLIHLAPFTCMPEIIAENIMPTTKEDVPVLTLICDEQMGKPGMLTRLEAFVDLIRRRRKAREKAAI